MAKEGSRTFHSLRNISLGFVCQIVTILFAFATRTIFVRLLGEEYTGVSSLFSNILTFLSLAELGIGNVLVFNLYKPLHEKDTDTVAQYMAFFRKLYYIIAAVILLLGLALTPFLEYIIGECSLPFHEIRLYFILYVINTVFTYLAVDKVTLIQADQKIFIRTVVQTVSSVLCHLAMIVYLLCVQNFLGYLVIQLVFTFGQNVVLTLIAGKAYPYLSKKQPPVEKEFKAGIVKNVKSMFLYKFSGVIINYTDNILISVLMGVSAVGLFSNYNMLLVYVTTFISYIISGITGSLGNLNAENNMEKSYRMFRNLIYLFNVITVFCVCCYFNAVQGFVDVWIGDKYLLGYDVVAALMFSFYVVNVINPVWMYRESLGMFSQIKYILFITALLNVLLSVLMGMWLGISGVIFATGISRILTVVWYEPSVLFKRKFGRSVACYWKMQLKQLLINALIFALCFFACHFLPNSFFWVLVKILICTVIVGLTECLTMRKTEEFSWIRSKLGGIVSRFTKKHKISMRNEKS